MTDVVGRQPLVTPVLSRISTQRQQGSRHLMRLPQLSSIRRSPQKAFHQSGRRHGGDDTQQARRCSGGPRSEGAPADTSGV